MTKPYFFGYGSLVNRATHSYPDTQAARLSGWQRVWRHTNLRAVAYLTVEPADSMIEGLIASVPNRDWSALDLREHAYDRVAIAPGALEVCKTYETYKIGPECYETYEINVQLYKTKPQNDAPPTLRHPILQSYLDTVISGYFDMFGEDGARAFFATTKGWDAPVLDDRKAPIYPRTTPLDATTRRFVDRALDTLGVERRAVRKT